ncbi:MAG: hypothetical protein HYW28_07355 [Rhodospirillales bacterium]|nr:hypothetical protein [Rhodospirillales bacterium]
MNRLRLQRLIEAYGADPARWPAAERDAARALLAQTPDAAAMRARARLLDEALDGFAPAADAGAEQRLLRALAELPRQAPAMPPLMAGFWPRAAMLAAASMAGVIIGLQAPAMPPLMAGFWPRAAMLAAASMAGVIIGLGGIDGRMPATADVDVVVLVGEPDTISLLE